MMHGQPSVKKCRYICSQTAESVSHLRGPATVDSSVDMSAVVKEYVHQHYSL